MIGEQLYRRNGGPPERLPFAAYDAAGNSWTNLIGNEEGRIASGFVEAPPKPDPRAVWDVGADGWVVPPPSPPPEPVPVPLGRLTFIMLAQEAGGMTDTMLVTAQKDERFEAFWTKFQMASTVERDHKVTSDALQALQATGYLPNGAAAVEAAWPVA